LSIASLLRCRVALTDAEDALDITEPTIPNGVSAVTQSADDRHRHQDPKSSSHQNTFLLPPQKGASKFDLIWPDMNRVFVLGLNFVHVLVP
jgi:hypothetical protein